MSTVAAIQGSTWAVVAYDSQVTEDGDGGGGRTYTLPRGMEKVCQNKGYVFGVAGDYRAVNVVSFVFDPPSPPAKRGHDLDVFMSAKFVPSLRGCFEASYYSKDGEHGSLLIVVVNGVVYEIGGNYDCIRDEVGLYAIGSGAAYALGSLFESESEKRTLKNAKDRAESAVQIAAALDSGTGEPVRILVQHWTP